MSIRKYIIASNRPFDGRDVICEKHLDYVLSKDKVNTIFFPFWSWKVPKSITSKYKCIGFHTGEKAGGSPIQNLIRDGERFSYVYMFRMNDTIDGGEKIGGFLVSLQGSLQDITRSIKRAIRFLINEYIQKDN